MQWYNWPYVVGVALGLASLLRLGVLDQAGGRLAGWLGIGRVSGRSLLRIFALVFGVVGLTLNGALHDYWPEYQERGFVLGLVLTLVIAGGVTRWLGRLFERNFPEIKAVGWGSPGLSGHKGRVVSRMVSPEYRAGRAQVMGDDETLHMVLCKTVNEEIGYGSLVVLGEYDPADGRYLVTLASEEEKK